MYIYISFMYIYISECIYVCLQYFVQDKVFSYFCGQNMTYGVWSSIIIGSPN